MKKLGPISLPLNHPSEYSRRMTVMLYQYLNETRNALNQVIDEVMAQTEYATRYDQVTTGLAYFGEAAVGSSTSSAVWRIKRLEIAADGDVTITWADGDSNFDNVWDDRASLTYS